MDDDQSQFAKDTVTRLIETLQAVCGTNFKTYFQATPTTEPPAVDFPLAIIQKLGGPIVLGPTQADEVKETVMLTFVLNRADDVGSANIRTTTMRHLQNLVEGQDPVTSQFKPTTVCFAIRTYLTQDEWLINSDVSIKYDIIPKKGAASLCVADVMLSTWRRVMIPNRQ